MTPSDRDGFNLIDRPWILVRGSAGAADELSILDVFRLAGQLAGIVGELPTQTFAITRLLLAILHRAIEGPRDDDHWQELWEAPGLPVDAVESYLARYRDRFDLRHPETPFFQVAGLRKESDQVSGVASLIADVPNRRRFFSMRHGEGLASISAREAARWLVHCQAFDFAGTKSGAVGDPRVKKSKGYGSGVAWSGLLGGILPEGSTVRETLLINAIAMNFQTYTDWRLSDSPAWERPAHGPTEEREKGRAPLGPIDLFTWQSRRLRLAWSGERATGVLVCNGDRLTPQNRHPVEPHTAWRRSVTQEKKLGLALVYMPREHDPDRAVWRGLQSLLPGVAGRGQASAGAQALAPLVLEWISHLREQEMLRAGDTVQLRAIGMVYGSNNSVIDEVIDDAVSVRVDVLRQDSPALAQSAVECAQAAEGAARTVGGLAGDLAQAAGGESEGPFSRARELAFAELDAPFRKWFAELSAESDVTQEQAEWHRMANRIALWLGGDLLARSPPAAWLGRQVKGRLLTTSHADLRFRKGLRKALPLAYFDSDQTGPCPSRDRRTREVVGGA